ncbi:hypothetical protein PR048_001516 [Dryococelus australis]|uniref:Uncharacterized protein n=1 Tax=Dryococelus australis TaxID=614101 RepID=A0ABQ9IHK3_9NEOP|nr:hypothetical protein PR048_001516 [Dryococelus australis]
MKGRGKREITEKTRRPTASYGTILTCENPGVNRPGLNPVRLELCILEEGGRHTVGRENQYRAQFSETPLWSENRANPAHVRNTILPHIQTHAGRVSPGNSARIAAAEDRRSNRSIDASDVTVQSFPGTTTIAKGGPERGLKPRPKRRQANGPQQRKFVRKRCDTLLRRGRFRCDPRPGSSRRSVVSCKGLSEEIWAALNTEVQRRNERAERGGGGGGPRKNPPTRASSSTITTYENPGATPPPPPGIEPGSPRWEAILAVRKKMGYGYWGHGRLYCVNTPTLTRSDAMIFLYVPGTASLDHMGFYGYKLFTVKGSRDDIERYRYHGRKVYKEWENSIISEEQYGVGKQGRDGSRVRGGGRGTGEAISRLEVESRGINQMRGGTERKYQEEIGTERRMVSGGERMREWHQGWRENERRMASGGENERRIVLAGEIREGTRGTCPCVPRQICPSTDRRRRSSFSMAELNGAGLLNGARRGSVNGRLTSLLARHVAKRDPGGEVADLVARGELLNGGGCRHVADTRTRSQPLLSLLRGEGSHSVSPIMEGLLCGHQNPPASGIVQHDSHITCENPGVNPYRHADVARRSVRRESRQNFRKTRYFSSELIATATEPTTIVVVRAAAMNWDAPNSANIIKRGRSLVQLGDPPGTTRSSSSPPGLRVVIPPTLSIGLSLRESSRVIQQLPPLQLQSTDWSAKRIVGGGGDRESRGIPLVGFLEQLEKTQQLLNSHSPPEHVREAFGPGCHGRGREREKERGGLWGEDDARGWVLHERSRVLIPAINTERHVSSGNWVTRTSPLNEPRRCRSTRGVRGDEGHHTSPPPRTKVRGHARTSASRATAKPKQIETKESLTAVAERLACSPPTKTNRVRSPAASKSHITNNSLHVYAQLTVLNDNTHVLSGYGVEEQYVKRHSMAKRQLRTTNIHVDQISTILMLKAVHDKRCCPRRGTQRPQLHGKEVCEEGDTRCNNGLTLKMRSPYGHQASCLPKRRTLPSAEWCVLTMLEGRLSFLCFLKMYRRPK